MSAIDSIATILLLALCGHVGVLAVLLVRGLIPQRRRRERTVALLAGACALAGELLVLRGFAYGVTSLPWVGGLLLVGLILGILSRESWRADAFGKAAFHAVVALPLVVLFVAAFSLR